MNDDTEPNGLYIPGKDGLKPRDPVQEAIATHEVVVHMDSLSVLIVRGATIAQFDMMAEELPIGVKLNAIASAVSMAVTAITEALGRDIKLAITGNPSGVAAMRHRLQLNMVEEGEQPAAEEETKH